MYKTNPYNGKKYKKKNVSSPIKDPYIISDKLANNKHTKGIDIFMELFHVENDPWLIFYRDILKGPYSSPWGVTNRLENIIFLTKDDGLQKRIYKELMAIKGYNPLEDELPVEKLSLDLQKYITNRREEIEFNYGYTLLTEQSFYKDDLYCRLAFSLDEKFLYNNFKENFDVVAYILNDSVKIYSNINVFKDGKEYLVSLKDVYSVIKEYFPTKMINRTTLEITLKDNLEAVITEIINIIQDKIILIEKNK